MAFKIFEIKQKFGWKALQAAMDSVENAINERAPKASETVDINEQPDGAEICVKGEGSGSSANIESGGGGGGTTANLYGAFNGAPALYHLRQTSAPTAL